MAARGLGTLSIPGWLFYGLVFGGLFGQIPALLLTGRAGFVAWGLCVLVGLILMFGVDRIMRWLSDEALDQS
jgi:hypothetical protein